MAPAFGTSGLRGLVSDLTDELVRDYVRAFLTTVAVTAVYVGRDLRESSPRISQAVKSAVQDAGLIAVDCGAVPTPALACASLQNQAAAIMVTGSHIPADRNGLKFYTPLGEITKNDEAAINAALGTIFIAHGGRVETAHVLGPFAKRYVDAFGANALKGLRVGVYQHSSVARDLLVDVLIQLGAIAVPLRRSEIFVPVDTEAVDPTTRQLLAQWCQDHELDAIVSTDGDADRPMIADATGQVIAGDVLGVLTALDLGAEAVVTPINANSMVEKVGFAKVCFTRIGSPYVIAGMDEYRGRQVVGFEPNGGFLLGFDAYGGVMKALPTRDCMLPILAPLCMAARRGVKIAELVAELPQIFTAADRLTDIPTTQSKAFIEQVAGDRQSAFFRQFGDADHIDMTDGVRATFQNGDVLHLRPSGNAPEFRVYAQSTSRALANDLLQRGMSAVRAALIDTVA